MIAQGKTRFALAAAMTCTVALAAPASADIVNFNADVPGLGTVRLTIDTSTAQVTQGAVVDPTGYSVPAVTPAGQQAVHAARFAADLLQDWSRPGSEGAWLQARRYAQTVFFYGERRSAGQVADERLAFSSRWPQRDYRLDPNSVQVSCNSVCDVWGQYDFVATNPATGARSAGRSSLSLTLEPRGNSFAIVAEDGTVLYRY